MEITRFDFLSVVTVLLGTKNSIQWLTKLGLKLNVMPLEESKGSLARFNIKVRVYCQASGVILLHIYSFWCDDKLNSFLGIIISSDTFFILNDDDYYTGSQAWKTAHLQPQINYVCWKISCYVQVGTLDLCKYIKMLKLINN